MLPLLAEGSSEPRVSAWCLNESVGGSGSTSAGTSNAQMFRMAAADPSSVSTVSACMLPEKGLLSGDTVSHNSAIEHALSSFPAIAVDNATTAPCTNVHPMLTRSKVEQVPHTHPPPPPIGSVTRVN
ncbi:hypothetical protein V6N11_053678 [Hibiscus sabdariffa]|uniref:Uncharacterized protein n=1 Tax=Hibiscus sabdariffa TaxID=183260 RepID=A0ABR2NEE5_9ROSI